MIRFWALVASMLALMAGLLVYTARLETQTYDEATHIAAGYSYWETGDYRLNVEHPPLAKMLAAWPLRNLRLQFETSSKHWVHANQIELGLDFLYKNTRSADDILFRARAPIIALTLLLGVGIAWWTKAKFGALAAMVALMLFALDSNFIAHGHYVTTDVAVTCFGFFAVVTWIAWLESGKKLALLFAAITLGLAMASKYSGLYLLPVHAMLLLVQLARRKRPLLPGVAGLLAVIIGGAAVCSMTYGRQTAAWWNGIDLVRRGPDSHAPFWKTPYKLIVPNHPYGHGLLELLAHDRNGHRTYLLGTTADKGRWQYFPVAFLVKTPAATLVLALGALLALPWLARRGDWFVWVALAAYPIAYFALSMRGNINIGVRHLLPIYAFLFVLAGAAVARLPRKAALGLASLAAVAMTAEIARAHPHHLAFFNAFVGGPANGHKYLLDSNLDWGQDVKKLKRVMERRGIDYVHIAYFGMADLKYYGIEHGSLMGADEPGAIRDLDGWAAVSATNVYDVYFDKETFGWVRKFAPMEKIGWSIYLYDLRQSTIPAAKRPFASTPP